MKHSDLNIKNNEFQLLEADITEVYNICKKKNIVLDYIFLKKETKSINLYETHKEVAIAAMLRIKKMNYDVISNNIITSPFSGKEEIDEIKKGNWPYFTVEIYEDKIFGEKITCNRFCEEKGYYEKYNSDGTEYGYWIHGYKDAFFEPPIPLYGSINEQEEEFNYINNKYLSPFNDENLEIYSWNDDWSNYFDSGKEYWGTFYWTIYNKKKDMYIVIAGSSTD